MPGVLASATALLGAIAAVEAKPAALKKRDVITALPEGAAQTETDFQPFLDFDTDGCYNTAAVDPDGNFNPGHDATGTPEGDCRDPHQLENSNVYSRSRCNNNICATMYEYYFEKDQSVSGSFAGGHKHDWENIVVFSDYDNNVLRVAPSCHGGYGEAKNDLSTDELHGTHPYMVYNKDGGGTHCFRFASGDDVAGVENFSGEFYRSPIVGWNNWPSTDLRDSMLQNWSGGVGPKLDDEFASSLADAAGDGVPDFDPNVDAP